MKIHFYGGARTTTGSNYLLEVNGRRILLECGLFQGQREESLARNRHLAFDPKSIDAAILSHAHIDHCGNLPTLCRAGYKGNIYCTFATRDLAAIMLEDSAHIQISDAEYVSKKRAKKMLPPVEPLYSATDAEATIRQFVAINYDRPIAIADGVTLTFYDAGHILGSAQVALDVQEGHRKFRWLFTGDIGRGKSTILRDPTPVQNVDALMIESTYGGREHAEITSVQAEFERLICATIARGGKVIIPAFAVGRTQTVVYILNQMAEAGRLPPVPIFVDSPLAVNATEVFRLHSECFNEETYRFLREKSNPFGMEGLTYIRDQSQSMKLNDLKGAAIIISASGMCEAGRIRHHLKNNIGDPANLILFVGFCAEHTLGSQLLAGKTPVNIFGEPVEVRAQIAKIDAFSGHADCSELSDYVRSLTGNIKTIHVVHGEESQALAFGETLRRLKPKANVIVPKHLEVSAV